MLPLSMQHKWEEVILIFVQNHQWKIVWHQFLTKSPTELKVNTNIVVYLLFNLAHYNERLISEVHMCMLMFVMC